MKNYTLIDYLKLFFAICIVIIHTDLLASEKLSLWMILHGICRLAVPFFFIASGFFYGRKLIKSEDIKSDLIKYCKRLFIPFCFWLVLDYYLFYSFVNGSGNLLLKTIQYLIFYPWGAMWYVLALLVAIPIVTFFYKKNKLKLLWISSIFLYLFALLCNNYYFIIDNTSLKFIIDKYMEIAVSGRNGLFFALYFVTTGFILAKEKDKIKYKINNFLLPLFYIIFLIEIFIIKGHAYLDDHSLYLSFLFLIPSILIFALQFVSNKDTTLIRNYSTGIYFSHRFIIMCVTNLLILFNISVSNIYLFFIVIIIDIILLGILYKINNKWINKVIK